MSEQTLLPNRAADVERIRHAALEVHRLLLKIWRISGKARSQQNTVTIRAAVDTAQDELNTLLGALRSFEGRGP